MGLTARPYEELTPRDVSDNLVLFFFLPSALLQFTLLRRSDDSVSTLWSSCVAFVVERDRSVCL